MNLVVSVSMIYDFFADRKELPDPGDRYTMLIAFVIDLFDAAVIRFVLPR
jgi:hypothetical protein